MRQKILIAVATGIAALGAAAIGVATAGRATESAQRYDHLANNGVPVVVSERNADILRSGGGEPVLNRLAVRGGLTFYAGRGDTGGPCYALGPVETGGVGALACLRPPASFPSPDAPILDMSGASIDPRTGSTTFLGLSGFAADGVASVGVIGADGVLHDAEVRDNVYYADLPRLQAKALIAVDASGEEIFRRSTVSQVVPPVAAGVAGSLLTQQERFHARAPDDPKRLGPLVEITSGGGWALIGWRSEVGICLDFAIPGNSPFGCDFPVRGAKPSTDASGSGLPTHAVAGFFSGSNLVGGDGKATIFGVAAHEVAEVKIELRDGQVISAPVYDAPPRLQTQVRFFIVRLPPGELEHRVGSPVQAYSAYDETGTLIERIED